ncbi:hypothetical protein [Cellulomonas hominis]|uniref:hypothetical protein n=1 Tax=Cellulomonas hominis TaxID=156981 RepID=UPI001BCE4CE1|nr:hypothetical protein [Cellulomonas hominis]
MVLSVAEFESLRAIEPTSASDIPVQQLLATRGRRVVNAYDVTAATVESALAMGCLVLHVQDERPGGWGHRAGLLVVFASDFVPVRLANCGPGM